MEPNDKMGDAAHPPFAALWVVGTKDLRDSDWEFTGVAPPERYGATVVVIQKDYTLDLYIYDTEEEMREAWLNFERTIDPEMPEGNDYVIWKDPTLAEDQQMWKISTMLDYPKLWEPSNTNPEWKYVGFGEKEDALHFILNKAGEDARRDSAWLYEGVEYLLLEWPAKEPGN